MAKSSSQTRANAGMAATAASTLLGNGVPLIAALKIAIETVDNGLLRNALAGIMPHVKEGGKMAQAMQSCGVLDFNAQLF